MSVLVKRLRAQITGDHIQGCEGRYCGCDCGFDLQTEGLLEMAATRIERLEANINRGLSLVADLERLGTIDSAISAELQIALGGGYPASPLPEDERTAHKTGSG